MLQLKRVLYWLEFARLELRPALRSNDSKKLEEVLRKISRELNANGGLFLVGNSLTAADVSIVVALDGAKEQTASASPPVLLSYVKYHMKSAAFVEGLAAIPYSVSTNDDSDSVPSPPQQQRSSERSEAVASSTPKTFRPSFSWFNAKDHGQTKSVSSKKTSSSRRTESTAEMSLSTSPSVVSR